MDLHATKIRFVQEFLRLKNERIVRKLTEVLREEKKKLYEAELKPMTQQDLEEMIDQAEADAEQGKLTDINTLRKDIDDWV